MNEESQENEEVLGGDTGGNGRAIRKERRRGRERNASERNSTEARKGQLAENRDKKLPYARAFT